MRARNLRRYCISDWKRQVYRGATSRVLSPSVVVGIMRIITWNDVEFSFGSTEFGLPERHSCRLAQRDLGWRESFESHVADEAVWHEDRRKVR